MALVSRPQRCRAPASSPSWERRGQKHFLRAKMRRKKRSTLCHCQVSLCFDRTPPAPMGLNPAVEQHFCSHSYFKPLMGLEKLGARSERRRRFWEGNPSIHSYIWTNWCCRSNRGMLEGTLKISVVGGCMEDLLVLYWEARDLQKLSPFILLPRLHPGAPCRT